MKKQTSSFPKFILLSALFVVLVALSTWSYNSTKQTTKTNTAPTTTFDITNAASVVTITGTPGAYWANGTLNAYAADWDGTMRQFTLCPNLTSWCSYSLTGNHATGDGMTALLRNGVPELFSASY
jgi:hypothetical protein